MASQPILGLPPVPTTLRSISPYIQRTHELKNQDPIMAYWCAYYAAQIGISIKAKDSASRDLLLSLLGLLEKLKRDIGPHDALDIEAVSSAYVENFALKVFAMADNEDRTGAATRSTAKKFLAAANFLEVLKIFPKADMSESATEKIKYAKWKAADIAKAFREGRKPTPGPADSQREIVDTTSPASPPYQTQSKPVDIVRSNQSSGSGSDKSIKRISPPSHINIQHSTTPPFDLQNQTPSRYQGSHLAVPEWGGEGEATPGSWSTAATPGTAQDSSMEWGEQPSPTKTNAGASLGHKPRSGSDSSSGSSSGSRGILKNAARVGGASPPRSMNERYASDQREFPTTTNSEDTLKKAVHFTPSVIDGLSDTSMASSTAPSSPSYDDHVFVGGHANGLYHPPQPGYAENPGFDLRILPPGFVPDQHQGDLTKGQPLPARISPPNMSSYDPYVVQHPPAPETDPTRHIIYAPTNSHHIAPQPPPLPRHHHSSTPPQPIVDLTPSIITKAQKHARFAISALDYEDAEQARKELRAALSVLGG